jgi:hypothetical protein
MLTPQQQTLLFAALNSNRPPTGPSAAGFNMSPMQFDGSPVQGADALSSFQNSPDLDYDYDFAGPDSSFDFPYDDPNQPKMIGDLPGAKREPGSDSADNESPEKRSHPDDDDDDDENGSAKRRESEEKVAKKPGRKPLTTEPSSVSYLSYTVLSVGLLLGQSLTHSTEAQGPEPRGPAGVQGTQGEAPEGSRNQSPGAREDVRGRK